MIKKITIVIFLSAVISTVLVYSEQITTVAIIDVGEVFDAFSNEARGYDKLNKLKESYQNEIDNQVSTLDILKREKVQALKDQDYEKAKRLEIQITNMVSYIDAISKQRQSDLVRRSKSPVAKEFLERLQSAISYVSEEKGYTLVLQSTMAGIQWWAPVIDITNDVIERLRVE